ncbi:hypothetical protein DS837_23125 [Azospirillum brasilense]|uniref:Uncharacterized protein n=1 Tax=Azospirillum brasilense TaxID=192 RepID=A0A6L3AXY3_AZOBR|nr:hypothetical protein DS837_23125 [Azospirillum brasilense]
MSTANAAPSTRWRRNGPIIVARRSIHPLPPREREGARAKRGKGEGTAKDRWFDPSTTLTRRLRRHPLPGRERE